MILTITLMMVLQTFWMIYRDIKMYRERTGFEHSAQVLRDNYKAMQRINELLHDEIDALRKAFK